jgi:hypothetical protein
MINITVGSQHSTNPLCTRLNRWLSNSWFKGLDLAPKSKGHLKKLMHIVFNCTMRGELLPYQTNPMGLVRVKDVSKRVREPVVLAVEQSRQVLEHIPEPYSTMCIVTACPNASLDYVVTDLTTGTTNTVTTQPINTRYGFGGGFFGDYTDIAAGSDDNFHAFWTDSNNQQTVVWWYGFQFAPTPNHQQDVVTAVGSFLGASRGSG